MAGIDIISDSTGKEIVAAIQSTDVAQARILEINTAAEAKKNEVLESIPEDYSNISKEVDELKGDLVELVGLDKDIELTFIDGEYVNKVGAILSYESWHRTDYIELCYPIKSLTTESNAINDDITYNVFFDEYKNFISWFRLNQKILTRNQLSNKTLMNKMNSFENLNINPDLKKSKEEYKKLLKIKKENRKMAQYYLDSIDNEYTYNMKMTSAKIDFLQNNISKMLHQTALTFSKRVDHIQNKCSFLKLKK